MWCKVMCQHNANRNQTSRAIIRLQDVVKVWLIYFLYRFRNEEVFFIFIGFILVPDTTKNMI